ncbi:MAG: F0F1 ATP synthase subunit C [Lentisphaerae bacterium ADurb.BinA184]|nr:MAG: F0F1 ATP synthase subunit C [Lentisphaerae bacterium ADurb.BinA184]
MLSPALEKLIVIIVVMVSVLGPSIVIGSVGHAAIQALGRNPSAAPKILIPMLLAFVFAEAVALVALLVAFQLFT